MNTLHKSLNIAILIIFISLSVLNVYLVGAQVTSEDTEASQPPDDPLQSRYLKFRRLTTENGLSSDQMWELAQDRHDFMWFGTADGLNRYDGADVKVYRHDPDDPNGLSHKLVRTVMADQSGDLWIGTWGAASTNTTLK